MKFSTVRGTTSKRIRVFVVNKSTNDPLTGVAYNAAGLSIKYARDDQSTLTTVTIANASAGTFTSGGWVEIGGGLYEFGVPDAALLSGDSVQILISGATNMLAQMVEIELTAFTVAGSVWEEPISIHAAGDSDLAAAKLQAMYIRIFAYLSQSPAHAGDAMDLIDGAIVAATVASSALNGKGDWATGADVTGAGATAVNHDTGGTDNYRILSSGSPVSGATISAYVKAEFDATPTTAVRRGQTVTGDDGRWAAALMLDSGTEYTIVIEAAGEQTYQFNVTP